MRELVDSNYRFQISKDQRLQYTISQQYNQLFRQIQIITGDYSDFNRYIVFVDCTGISVKREEFVGEIIRNGFTINNQRFELSERSASMTRNSILSFVDSTILQELNERVVMGIDVGEVVLSKYYAYRGLMLSSCHCIENWYPKVIVVSDLMRVLPNQRVKCLYDKETTYTDKDGNVRPWKQKDVKEITTDIELNVFDGCGIHDPRITDYIQSCLKIRERPTSMIVRMPFIKGVSHEMDYVGYFAENGITEITDIWGQKHSVSPFAEPMFILTESMYKGFKYFQQDGTYADWENYWELFKKYNHCIGISKWQYTKEKEPVYSRANYQILQDLDLDYDTFKCLAADSVEWAEKIINCDQLYTYCFLGLLADSHDDADDYGKAILKNPEMLKDSCVRDHIRSTMRKYRDEFCCGKIWLKGAFKFIAPDLVALMQHIGGITPIGCLKEGEFYSHDVDGAILGEMDLERNPHICSTEHVILTGVQNEGTKWVEHLDNVCMINCWEIVPQRLQGCDFDGDLVFLLDNDTFRSGVHRNAPPVIDMEDKITVAKERDSFENRIKVILRSMRNNIGEFSNYASAYHNRCPQSKEQKNKYESYIDIIAVVTGKSIDHAKTGVMYYPPVYISKFAKPLPYFMKYRGETYSRQKLSKSQSNMNRLCFDLEKWNKQIKWSKSKNDFDYHIMIDDSVFYTQEQYDKILEIYNDFLKTMNELGKFQTMCHNYNKYKDYFKEQGMDRCAAASFQVDYGAYYDHYRELCDSVCSNHQSLANILVRICYEECPKKDKKFLWIVAADGVIKNIKQVKHKLPIRDINGTDWYMGRQYIWVDYEGE